ncbi:pre-mRNA-splicing factor ATP-dependent RNA helicase Prp16p [[Candida] anglica]|uniref:RNA helicase n=1 Tax=[Candida] anglica TaxID=148631 RepID=A0ABP0ECJ5_9ASCO
MDILGRLTERISYELNRPANENTTHALIRFYLKDQSLSGFTNYCGAFGLKRDVIVKDLHTMISDNVELLKYNVDSGMGAGAGAGVGAPKSGVKKKKKPLLFDLEEMEGDEENVKEIKQDDKPLKPKFKKMNRDKAKRIKEEKFISTKVEETKEEVPKKNIEVGNVKKSMSLSELAEKERVGKAQKEENSSLPDKKDDELSNYSDTSDIENDREWYTTDEFNTVAQDYDDASEVVNSYESHSRRSREIASSRHYDNSLTGGGFDSTGQYIDHDHQNSSSSSNDLSRIPLVSHYLVPPFLTDSKEYLSVVVSNLGPTIDPVREPSSELAVTAHQGSAIVKDKKSREERAKKAKERSDLAGTALGNVLGIKDSKDKEEEEEDKRDSHVGDTPSEISMMEQRRNLPAFSVREPLLQTIRDNQVTIVIGETGSGKTTQLTQFLYEEGYGKGSQSRLIGCTQPRRVAAMSVAKRVSQEMNCKLGEECGFSIRFEDKTNPKTTVIKYMTEGILLREVLVDPNLDKYSCVIMDEAHERSLNTDVLLGLFKQVLARRSDLKLIVTSATMNADRFAKFFGDAPQFTIPGRTYPVDVLYSKSGVSDYVDAAVKQVVGVHLGKWRETVKQIEDQKLLEDQSTTMGGETDTTNKLKGGNDGDILVFMTGQEDIETTCSLIESKLSILDSPPPLDVLPIYSTLPADVQNKIFAAPNPNRRKCVVATNIAETSLTVDGVRYVIDTGLSKMKVYNPRLGMDALQVVPISVANAQQRSGRAGRTAPGIAYRLYTERATESSQMYQQPIPEIQRTNLSNVMLLLKSLGVNDILKFPFLDEPPRDLLACSLYELWAMGALDNLGDLTPIGRSMAQIPMDPALAKLVLLSCKPEFSCSDEVITIVAMLSVPSVWFRPKERAQEADRARERFLVGESDHLTLVNVYKQWRNAKRSSSWCARNFLHHKSLLRAHEVKQQMISILQAAKLPIVCSKSDEIIRKCICAAYFHQSAKLSKSNITGGGTSEFIHIRHNYMKMYLHPTSALNGDLAPAYVVYHELILTNREYMSCVTAVDPIWLLEYGYIFYGVSKAIEAKIHKVSDIHLVTKEELEQQLSEDEIKWKKRSEQQKFKRKKVITVEQNTSRARRAF